MLVRTVFATLGALLVALGVVGAFLPLLPSTIFFIMAAGCFARSSPTLEAWLLDHRTFGPPIRAWRENGAISRHGKMLALGGMAFGYTMFYLGARPSPWLAVGVAAFFIGSALFVATRPSP